jgi:uncharacterized protein (TIGR00299 family) protein
LKTALKTAYFDCFSGISGDMCIGAIVDAGVPLEEIESELRAIPLKGYSLRQKKVKRSGFSATKVDVVLKEEGGRMKSPVKTFRDIREIIQTSRLSRQIRQKGLDVFRLLFEAEAKVHGKTLNTVHLHELGALDCIVDIIGTIIGLSLHGVERVFASPVNVGSGFVTTEHGILPVPAPAAAEILKNVPVYSSDMPYELATPTGVAILKGLTSAFGDIPCMEFESIGIGAGSRDFKNRPNVLRIFIGSTPSAMGKGLSCGERVSVIETNIDDMNPQIYESVMEKLFEAGALDVYLTNIIMKKGRPGITLSALCEEDRRECLCAIILKETSSIGLRFYEAERRTLQREILELKTDYGKVRVKISGLGDMLKASPEYEDCKKIAGKLKIPLRDVLAKILASMPG